jgi:hypothetical protein
MMVGFRIHDGLFRFLFAVALVLLFAFAVSWMVAAVGRAPQRRGAQAAMFPDLPADLRLVGLRGHLIHAGLAQAFANHQPVTYTVDAAVTWCWAAPAGTCSRSPGPWRSWRSFAPLAVRRYRRAA